MNTNRIEPSNLNIYDKLSPENDKVETTSKRIDKIKENKSIIGNSIDKVKNLFRKNEDKDLIIHHLGGLKVSSFDPTGKQLKLNMKHYLYERVPISIAVKGESGEVKRSEIFLYGMTLEKYVKEWIAKTEAEETTDNFQNFAAKRLSEDSVEINQKKVRYFNDEERKKTEVVIDNGELMQIGLDNKNNEKKNLEGTYAFVLATVFDEKTKKMKKIMFATPKVSTEEGKIQHSSFLRGGNVLSAGMLKINTIGNMLTIYNHSGHYKPTDKEIAHIVKHLEESGYDISKIHVNYIKDDLFSRIINKMQINIKWGIVQGRADKWLKEIGNKLIEQDLEEIKRFNEKTEMNLNMDH
jgi:hypothetical protein